MLVWHRAQQQHRLERAALECTSRLLEDGQTTPGLLCLVQSRLSIFLLRELPQHELVAIEAVACGAGAHAFSSCGLSLLRYVPCLRPCLRDFYPFLRPF